MHPPVLLSATTTALVIWILTAQFGGRRNEEETVNPIEKRRRQKLCEGNFTFHWLGNVVRNLAEHLQGLPVSVLRSVDLQLHRARDPMPWQAAEWLATTIVESFAAACLLSMTWLLWCAGATETLWLLPGCFAVCGWIGWRRLRNRARLRIRKIRARLPFVIDSIGLSMEAGASFQESLSTAADSCPGTPVGQELSVVVADVRRGQPLKEVLESMKRRLQDDLVDEFIMAGNTSHQLGAGMSCVMLEMSKRMRQRRSHEIEAAAGRAQIKLYYPGMLLLIVCLVAVMAPFVAPMWSFLNGKF